MRTRSLLFLFFTLVTVAFVSAQQSAGQNIPSVILNDFATAYPDVTDYEWERDGNLYQVEFETAEDMDHEIWYDANGSIVRREIEIPTEQLPAAVLRAVAEDFDGYAIDDAERVTTPDGEIFQMELEALLKEDWEVAFTADGRLLSKEED